MTAKEPMWGTGTSTPDGYALRDSEVVLRLLLPAQVTGVADRVPWRTVARAFGDVTRVDGYTSWVELTELSSPVAARRRHRAIGLRRGTSTRTRTPRPRQGSPRRSC
jgi:hypothetical protein